MQLRSRIGINKIISYLTLQIVIELSEVGVQSSQIIFQPLQLMLTYYCGVKLNPQNSFRWLDVGLSCSPRAFEASQHNVNSKLIRENSRLSGTLLIYFSRCHTCRCSISDHLWQWLPTFFRLG